MNTIQVGEYKMINIGRRIKDLREEKDMSARKLAELTKLDPSQISKIEKGVSKPSLDALERICIALNISLAEFFSADNIDIPTHQQQLLDSTKSLSPDQIKLLNDFLNSLNR